MRGWIISVLVLLSLCWQSAALQAQTALPAPDAPLMGSEASPTLPANPAVAAAQGDEPIRRILVIGDALAGGLGNGMARFMQDQPGYDIFTRFNESSGLARREVYDWSVAFAKIAATKPVDGVVVLVGVNDRQEIRAGQVRHHFKSPEWVQGYSANIDGLIDAIQIAGAKLYWVSIPPMADTQFDADMRYLSDLHLQRVTLKKANYIDIRSHLLTADGKYIDSGLDETGTLRKLRTRDGIAFMKQGNNRFGQLVMQAVLALDKNGIESPVLAATPKQSQAETETKSVVPQQDIKTVTEPPIFGQTGLEGENLVFPVDGPKQVQTAATPKSIEQKIASPNVSLDVNLRKSAAVGSAAEVFFKEGLTGDIPVGRFDDYLLPASQ